ncbi:MAG: Do family serine endopeptidase [Gammaproteobacteria bacterium]|nr:Do family serine endopeptidase [Gammaproteobacteria bacterium]
MRKLFLCSVYLLGALFLSNSFAQRPIINQNDNTSSLAPMLKNVMPGVVNIRARGELSLADLQMLKNKKKSQNFNFPYPPKYEDLGSGVIVDAEHGYVITNAHLIKDAQAITVTLSDGRSTQAKIVGSDAASDIGILQINAKRLTALKFGDSDQLKVGDFVCAIGSPFGLSETVTSGVVSSLERTNLGIESFENFIQTDAPINPGNSGGALVNMRGELVGINTAIITASAVGGSIGIGLAIPSNMAKSVMQQIIEYGQVKRGMLGVIVQKITPALAETMHLSTTDGGLVSTVLPNTPAAAAGIVSKDVIVKINDKAVHTATQVQNTVSLSRAGSEIKIQVLRNSRLLDLKTTVGDPEKIQKAMQDTPKQLLHGLMIRDFNQLVNGEQIKGVEILSVEDNSAAYSSGLRAGDVIVATDNKPVSSIDQLREIAKTHTSQLLLEVKRGANASIFVALEE